MAISTNGAIITRLAGALYNEYLSNATYTEVIDTAPATLAANWLSNDFAGQTDKQLATTILTNLGLTSITGLDNWLAAQFTAAGSSSAAKGTALVSILNSYAGMSADATYGSYATAFNARVSASLTFSQTDGNLGGVFGESNSAAVSGKAFTLGTSADNLSGSTGNDSFSAPSGTLSSADQINGGSGTDTLTATIAGSVTPFSLKGVENFMVTTTAAATFGLLNADSEASIENIGSTNDLTFSNITNLAAELKVSNIADTHTTFSFPAATTAGTADSVHLTVNDVVTETNNTGVSIAGVETVRVTATGGDSVLKDFLASSMTKLVVDGEAYFEVTDALPTKTVTVDASANSGGVTIALATTTATVTGGSGDDTLDISAAAGTTVANLGDGYDTLVIGTDLLGTTGADTIDGGAGIDYLNGVSDALETLDDVVQTNITNFEVVEFSDEVDASETFDARSIVGVTKVIADLGTDGTLGLTLPTGGGTFQLGAVTAGAPTGTTAALGDTLTVTAYGTGTTDSVTFAYGSINADSDAKAVVGSGVETFTVSNTKVADTFGAITLTGTAGAKTTVNFTGNKAMTAGVITANTVDASGLTAAAAGLTMVTNSTATNIIGGAGNDTLYTAVATSSTVDGGAGNDSITGGSGNDSLSGGAGDDSITAGAGNDKLYGNDGNDTFVLAGNLTANDIVDGGAGNDTLSISSAVTDGAAGAAVLNMETLSLTADMSQDMSVWGGSTFTKVSSSAASGAFTLSNLGTGVSFALTGATPQAQTLTRAVDTTSNSLEISIGKAASTGSAAAASAVVSITANNEETITITSKGADSSIATLTATDLRTLVLKGDVGVSIPTLSIDTGSTTAGALTIDATGTTSTVNVGGTANNATVYSPVTFTAGSGAATVRGGAGADKITGGAADDSIIGAAGNDSIVGGAGNDTINAGQGSDTVDGGDGTDTYISGVVPGTDVDGGVGAIAGVFINIGSSAKSVADVNTAMLRVVSGGLYTAGSVIDVAAGTAINLFASSIGSASTRTDTLTSIENVTGTSGQDYIIGSSAANIITGGAGADVLSGGSGVDSFVYASGASAADAVTLTFTDDGSGVSYVDADTAFVAALEATETVQYAEVITDLSTTDGSGETIVLGNADLAAASVAGKLVDDKYIIVQGTYTASTGTFAIGASLTTGEDSLLMWDADSSSNLEIQAVILVGVNSTEAAYLTIADGTLTV